MTVVYYEEIDLDGLPGVAVTAKDYWDTHRCLDDGEGRDYEAIMNAMAACRADEDSSSLYTIDWTTIDDLIANMREHGFELRKDEAFSFYVKVEALDG